MEMQNFSFDIVYIPGAENAKVDALSRSFGCVSVNVLSVVVWSSLELICAETEKDEEIKSLLSDFG